MKAGLERLRQEAVDRIAKYEANAKAPVFGRYYIDVDEKIHPVTLSARFYVTDYATLKDAQIALKDKIEERVQADVERMMELEKEIASVRDREQK